MAASSEGQNRYLFLSDAHLGGFSKEKNRKIEEDLIELVDYCLEQQIQIAVLGDLFDYWMEYPGSIPALGKKLLDRFEEYNSRMGRTIYITGNHDNWTRDHFEKRGFEVTGEQKMLSLGGKKIMLLHGDGLRHKRFNLPRPAIHRLLRNPKFIRLYQKLLPPRAGLTLMKYFSRLNRMLEKNRNKQEKLNKWAKTELEKTDTDVIICGHDHIPRVKKFDFGTFLNLGNFCHNRTVALYNNGSFCLVLWDEEKQNLRPFRNEK